MKFINLLLAASLLAGLYGCSMTRVGQQLDAAGDALEDRVDAAGDALEDAMQTMGATTAPVTREEAEAIALDHAGLTADQVTGLRTEYEIDDGIPRYEVQFRHDRWEYDYEINANTGELLSWDRDD